MKKNILVTGGYGFIASHVIKVLLENNFNVFSIDNLSNSKVNKSIGCKYYEGDFSDENILNKINDENKIDLIMHFAASISVEESTKNPEKYFENNTNKTKKLLSWMKSKNIKNIIFSSTAATFGNPISIPIKETDLQKPINPYGESKLLVEKEIIKSGLNYVIFRYFNVAGASDDLSIGYNPVTQPSHIIPILNLTFLGLRNEFKIFGTDYNTPDGTAIRDYIHVVDLAQAHFLGVKYLFAGNKSNDFNLGSENGTSILEVIKAGEKATGLKLNYSKFERRAGDPAKLVASNEKTKAILHWEPTRTIEDMIKSDFLWQKKLHAK